MILVVVMWVISPNSTGAQELGTDSSLLDPDPLTLQYAGVEGPLPLHLFIEASLLFSGVESAELPKYRDAVLQLVETFRQQTADLSDPKERAESILTYLHESVFSRYQELQTRIDTLIETGSYNCVSSAVVYTMFATAAGLRSSAVRTPDHAFCTVRIGDDVFDVETTSPYGFDPGSKKEFADHFGKVTGYAYVPLTHYRERTAVGQKKITRLDSLQPGGFCRPAKSSRRSAVPGGKRVCLYP